MNRLLSGLFRLVVCLAVMGTPAFAAAPDDAPRAQDFGRLPAMRALALSPNGNRLAWIDNYEARPFIVIFDLTTNKEQRRAHLPQEMKLRDLDWSDDQTVLVDVSVLYSHTGKSADQREWFRTLALNADDGSSRILLHVDRDSSYVTGSSLVAARTRKPNTILMSTLEFSATSHRQDTGNRIEGGRKNSGVISSLFEVDTRTGEGTVLYRGTPFTSDWIADANGDIVARTEWEAARDLYRVLRRDGKDWDQIYRQTDGEEPVVLGVNKEGTALLMRGALGKERRAIWKLPLDGGAPQVMVEDPVHDISAAVYDPYSHQPVGGWVAGPTPEIRWFDEQSEKRATAVQKAFAGKGVSISGRSADYSRVLAVVGTHATPDMYYLVDFKRGTAEIVGEDYPALTGKKLGEVRELNYKARDGMEIPAYLTLPPGVEHKLLPTVVLPHGGPESRDTRDFNWIAQFLATRGYVVLQPQFRGSTGYGEAFRRAGYRQWGGLMQDDVTDGVKALIEQGIADPKRICIAGLSYGGYSALAGAAFTPDLYACAISINGVADLPQMLMYDRRQHGEESDSIAYWKEHIGPADDPNVIARSPARSPQTVQAPILLMHGVGDTVVPIQQSRTMADALKRQRKPHSFIELPGEDHWLSTGESRIRVLQEMETFLAKNLLGGGDSKRTAAVEPEAAKTECRREARTGSIVRNEVCRERNNRTSEMRQTVDDWGRRTVPPAPGAP